MRKSAKQKLRNIHPGEVLREEFLLPLGISQYRLAKEIGVTEARIPAICSGKRAVTADTALRLAAFFGTTSGFWMVLQTDYDTEEAAKELSSELAQIHRFEPMAAGVRESRLHMIKGSARMTRTFQNINGSSLVWAYAGSITSNSKLTP